MDLSREILLALITLIGTTIGGILAYRSATRNAAKQVRLERERLIQEEESKRIALLASVHKEAADSGRELYQQLCDEQQKRIAQQHADLEALSADVTLLRGQLVDAQKAMAETQRELLVTQDELRATRSELQETRDLLESTKKELITSRAAQQTLQKETNLLRARIIELENELAKYNKSSGG